MKKQQQAFTVKECAMALNLSERTIRRMIKDGQITAVRGQYRRRWSIPADAVARAKGDPNVITQTPQQPKSLGKARFPELLLAKRLERHFNELVQTASSLLGNGLDDLVENPVKGKGALFEYVPGSDISGGCGMTREGLRVTLAENLYSAIDRNGLKVNYLCSHLEAEVFEIATNGINKAIQDNPYSIVRVLQLLVDRKTFKGTCDICKDLQ